MNEVQLAYKAWADTPPYECRDDHYICNEKEQLVPKPDSQVCDREKAWRKYCRLRDQKH